MFNKLLEKGELKYAFTDERKQYYIQQGGSLASIFKSLSPHLINFNKKLLPALRITTASTLTSHGISKALNKKEEDLVRNFYLNNYNITIFTYSIVRNLFVTC